MSDLEREYENSERLNIMLTEENQYIVSIKKELREAEGRRASLIDEIDCCEQTIFDLEREEFDGEDNLPTD